MEVKLCIIFGDLYYWEEIFVFRVGYGNKMV